MAKATTEKITTLVLSKAEAKAIRDLIASYVRALTTRDDHPDMVTFEKLSTDNLGRLQEITRAFIAASFNEDDDDDNDD